MKAEPLTGFPILFFSVYDRSCNSVKIQTISTSYIQLSNSHLQQQVYLTACPPFSTRLGSMCIYQPRYTLLPYEEAKGVCEGFTWKSVGSLMMPRDKDDYDFITFYALYK